MTQPDTRAQGALDCGANSGAARKGAARRACSAPHGLVLHGAILTPAARAEHRTMVRGTRPATDEEAAIDVDRAVGPEHAPACRAEGA